LLRLGQILWIVSTSPLTTFINVLELFYRLLVPDRAKRGTRGSAVGSVTRLRAGRPGI